MLRIGIIGAGGIAKRHLEALCEIDQARVTAVVDINRERAEAFADSVEGAEVYDSLGACLEAIDAALILTPPQFHRESSIEAIQAGKHVMIEKPLAVTVEDGEAIVAAAAEHNVKAMTAFNMRFRPGYGRLRELVAGGELGDVVQCWSQRFGGGGSHDNVVEGKNWRTTSATICGMTVESLSHDIDLLRWMMGDVVEVKACTRESNPQLPGFDDNASLLLTFASGAYATIHASWSSWLGFNNRGVVGTEGAAMITGAGLWNIDRLHLRTKQMKSETIEELENGDLNLSSYLAENRHFVESVLNDTPLSVTVEDGLAALKVSRAALKSSCDGCAVTINAVTEDVRAWD